ncbi:MAG: hypothetical protein HKP10_02695 [Kiritimatiellales bacterium]|nr:hypothetical protein [Pontiella sp.]NNJ70180.1 hypothetical protein [Kiritimatiellales bacterium]
MMLFRLLSIGTVLAFTGLVQADEIQTLINQTLADLEVATSDAPYSRTIERMYVGCDHNGNPKTGMAYREVKSYKPITGVVIVDKTPDGFVLREALFPDIGKIRNAKDRRQVMSVLKQFKNVPFDPYAEKSAVDVVSGATRHGHKTTGYLNHLARKTALEMLSKPDWPQTN